MFSKLSRYTAPLSYFVTFAAGVSAGAVFMVRRETDQCATSGAEKERADILKADILKGAEKKMRKLQRAAQERVMWKAVDKEMLGLSPRMWVEVFDKRHRYATLVYEYWRRWQLSDSNDDFWDWLDYGLGSMIDLPQAPRRLLDEWQVVYLNREQQSLFRVIVEPSTGRFLWEADGTPVTLPAPRVSESLQTARERAVASLLVDRLSKSDRRDAVLAAARQEVEAAIAAGDEPVRERLVRVAEPLIQEGLVCQLRDPYFEERLDAARTPLGHQHHWSMLRLPEELLPNLRWEDLLRAIAHDEGKEMRTPLRSGEDRLIGHGIFVLDSFGPLYCGSKIRGVLQHSSFVRGHCVKVAGGLVITDGWLRELSPHSGHYQPGQETVEDMISDWRKRGVDFSKVHIKPFMKGM